MRACEHTLLITLALPLRLALASIILTYNLQELKEMATRAVITPRGYQLECLSKAREGNVIICLETGCGKTLIAAMLLKELSFKFSSSMPCIAVFLVPTVMLVQQQANAIVEYADLKVGQYNGQNDDRSKWDIKKWECNINNLEVLVMTPQILLNVLHHAFIKLEAIKVLVFDECHHCQKGHPYAQIMEEYYFKTEICNRPKVLGMTASPVIRKGKSEFQCTQDINSLESLLDAKIITVENRNDLEAIVPSPCIEIKEYNRVHGSLDRLQSLVEIIHKIKAKQSDQPSEAIGLDQIGRRQRRKEAEGLERICRDLEYCIYELGLWFARYAAKAIFSTDEYFVGERKEEVHEATHIVKKNLLLRDVHECLSQAIQQGGYVEDLEVESLKPDLVSNKVTSLVDVLLNNRFSQLKCIVFVERVVAAKVLAFFLSKILKSVRCDHIVGNHSKNGSSSKSHMSKTLSDFRSGMVDLLVATNVAEEGLDIQDCCLVVHFDMPKTLRSFIQSRGRARVRSSHYVILMDRTNISDGALLDTLIHSESFVKEKILQGHDPSTNPRQRGNFDAYEVESTGAIVNTHSSVQLLYRYCSKLPSDEFYLPQPSFHFLKEQDGIKCCITLPSNACIRRVEGETCDSEIAAKKAACLKACRILHSKGALTDYLLPQASTVKEDNETSHHSIITKATTEELQETVVPTVWLRQPTSSSSVICLQAYRLSFDAIPGDREYSSFVLLLHSPLPEEATSYCEILQLRHGRAVLCKLEPVKNVFLDHFQVAQAEQFQSILFSVLLDRDLEHSKTKEPPISDGSWYLLLPLKRTQEVNPSKDQEIDWNRISKLTPFEDSNNFFGMTENAYSKVDVAALHFSNGVICIEDVPGLLVKTVHGKHLYCIIEMFTDLTAESSFPNTRYNTYVEYFKTMYDHELVHKGQHLVKARFLREAHNFLLARSREKDHGSKDAAENLNEVEKSSMDPEKSLVELPPEVCRIEFSGFYDDLINAAVILPSVLHKLESILVATQFHKFLSSQFPEGSQVSIEKTLEALTTQKCLDSFSLERLELLGDSFLKYAIARRLFLVHEEADEGFLSLQRMQRICNSSLFTLGTKLGVAGYIRDTLFDPKHWVAPCHPSKALCDESKLGDLHGDSSESKEGKASVTCNKRHRWMQRKTVADVIEALIGAYLEDGGEHAALSFMEFIGLEVATDISQIDKIQSSSVNNLPLITRLDIGALEKLLSYSFTHKGLLIEAFTHASFTNHLGKCYQRLEFLGDSVLDFLITKHLYNEFKDSKPGELTDLRSTIVSNESFARIAVQHDLHVYLIENSGELRKGIKQCISYIYTSAELELIGDWEGDKCSKVLADILESLSGAICVDGGFNLSRVWEVFEPILQPLISSRIVRLHPVRELQEVCQKNHLTWSKSLSRNGGQQCQYAYEINVSTDVIKGTAVSKDKKSAKKRAALDALAKLKVLGYVHSCKGETVDPQKRKSRDSTLAKEASDKLTSNSMSVKLEFLATRAGSGTHHIWDHTASISSISEKFEDIQGVSKADEPQFRMGSFATLAKEPLETELGASNVNEPQCRVSSFAKLAREPSEGFQNMIPSVPWLPTTSSSETGAGSTHHVQDDIAGISEKFEKTLGVSDVNEPQFRVGTLGEDRIAASIADYKAQNFLGTKDNGKSLLLEIKDQQKSTSSNSSLGTPTTSTLVAERFIWQHLKQENSIKNSKPGDHLQHTNMSPENSGPGLWLMETNDVGVRNETNLHFVKNPGLAYVPAYTIDMTMQAASRGLARASLHEACTRKRWKSPSFTCSHEEGPPHDKRFTYDVILQLPLVGRVECRGDPRKSTKEAMDSAAAELLTWLASTGYL